MHSSNISAIQEASAWIATEFPGAEGSWFQHAKNKLAYDDSYANLYKYHLRRDADYENTSLPENWTSVLVICWFTRSNTTQ